MMCPMAAGLAYSLGIRPALQKIAKNAGKTRQSVSSSGSLHGVNSRVGFRNGKPAPRMERELATAGLTDQPLWRRAVPISAKRSYPNPRLASKACQSRRCCSQSNSAATR
jgi:hypothetical protein